MAQTIAARYPQAIEPRRPQDWGPFIGATYVIVVLLASSNLPTPLYPTYGRAFGISPLVITLIFSTYAFVVIPSLLIFGPLSDAIGRRRVFLPALGLALVSMALFAASNGVAWLFVAQIFEGVSLGALQGTAAPSLIETDPSENRRRASAVASAATVGGAALGPVLAGLLAQYGPFGRRLPYLIEIPLLVIALVVVQTKFPNEAPRKRYRPRRPTVPPEIRHGFVVAAVSTFVAWAVTALFLSLIPSFVETITGTHNVAIFGSIVTLMLGSAALIQGIGQRWTSLTMQMTGISSLGLGLAAVLVAGQTKSLGVLLAAAVLAGIGLGLAFMGALGDVNDIAPDDRKGDIVASFYVVTYVGTAIPVIGVGLVALTTGLLEAINIFAYVAIAICLAGLFAQRNEHLRRKKDLAERKPWIPTLRPASPGTPTEHQRQGRLPSD